MTIALTEYTTKLERKVKGVCSNWLENAKEGEVVPFWLRKGTLPYPTDGKTPVIVVGPGKLEIISRVV